jgi:hypothetical protein
MRRDDGDGQGDRRDDGRGPGDDIALALVEVHQDDDPDVDERCDRAAQDADDDQEDAALAARARPRERTPRTSP